jgi:uncharacterized protein (DUF1697 family)
MTVQIALLRAVNVAAHGRLAMADLRRLMEDMGLAQVRTLLQTGNVVFESARQSGAALERALETAVAKSLALETDFFVRTAREWTDVVAANPFPDEAERDPGHLVVMALKQAADAKSVKQLQAAITGREVVRAKGNQLYIVYPDGIGRSKLTNSLIERKLGTRGTGRNWNTVLKLAALAAAS